MKIYFLALGILALTITSALAAKKDERKPSSVQTCNFTFSTTDNVWVITAPDGAGGTRATTGTLEQMSLAAYHLSQARICAF